MTRIAVFDSGLGSLSIIKPIQKKFKCTIIYFADQDNFPYGLKSKRELKIIIKKSITFLEKNYRPDFIIMGSNTPSLLLDSIDSKIIKIVPPLIEVSKLTKTNNIAILATQSSIESKGLKNFIVNCKIPKTIKIHKINASSLIELVESGKFLSNKKYSKKLIQLELGKNLIKNKIDVVTLSSTHLPFLKPLLQAEFPNVLFFDPSNIIIENFFKEQKITSQNRNSIKIITTGKAIQLKKILFKLGIKNSVTQITPL